MSTRHVAEVIAEARAAGEVPITPVPAHVQDQYRAANAEAHALHEQIMDHVTDPVDVVAGTFDVGVAILKTAVEQRGVTVCCEHLRDDRFGVRPMVALLSPRILLCEACFAAGRYPPKWEDDMRCDFCQDLADGFYEVLATVGVTTFIGQFCEPCAVGLEQM